jgi:hypothetical protein
VRRTSTVRRTFSEDDFISTLIPGATEPNDVAPAVEVVTTAASAADLVQVVGPRAASHHPDSVPGIWPGGIALRRASVVIFFVPVCHPLPGVPRHIQRPIGAGPWRFATHRPGFDLPTALPGSIAHHGVLTGCLFVPPGKSPTIGPSCCLLPLRLCRQPRPGLLAVRPGVVPVYPKHRLRIIEASQQSRA